jgi:hypothetical protein
MPHTPQELNTFEQITFKNMVTSYREELQRMRARTKKIREGWR